MRRGSFNSFIPLALLAMAFAGEAVAASRPRTPLLQVRVADPANQAAQFISFMPTNKSDLVWADVPRRTAWSQRVAGKMGFDSADNVVLLPFSESFRIVAREPELEFLLQVGMEGAETLSTTLDSGRRVSRDNRFEIVAVSESAISAVWKRVSRSPFRLRCEQGAGQDIWFVTCDELEGRWRRMVENGQGGEVRREVNLVIDALDRESTSICKGDREEWREWLFEFKEQTPATWPSIVFQNSYADLDGVAKAVVVTCGGETSRIPAKGTGTKTWANWNWKEKGTPEIPVKWTFQVPEDNLLDDDFGGQVIETWSPKGGASNVLVQVNARPKPRPYIILGRDVFAIPEIWAALAPSGDSNQDCDLKVEVKYKDGASVIFSGARGVARRLAATPDGEALWKVELLPNAEIEEIVVSSPAYFFPTPLHLDRAPACYKCGEEAHVKQGEKVRLLPWPQISVVNKSKFPVDYELFFASDGSATTTSVQKITGVEKQGKAIFDLSKSKIKDEPATNASVFVVGTAPGASNGYFAVTNLLRGGRAVVRDLELASIPLEWLSRDERIEPIDEAWSFLVLDYTFQGRYLNPEQYLEGCRTWVFQDERFQKIFNHYVNCPDREECDKCNGFRRLVKAQIQNISGAPANIKGRWDEKVPDTIQNAKGRGDEMVAVFLALCAEYYEATRPPQTTAYENIAKRLCGEWPRD